MLVKYLKKNWIPASAGMTENISLAPSTPWTRVTAFTKQAHATHRFMDNHHIPLSPDECFLFLPLAPQTLDSLNPFYCDESDKHASKSSLKK